MAKNEYQLLHQCENLQLSNPLSSKYKRLQIFLPILATVLIISLSVNALQLLQSNLLTSPPYCAANASDVSRYARNARTVPSSFYQDDIYTSHNRTIANAAWEEVRIDLGLVALSDAFVEEHALMPSQRFPWDASKGIYLINAYHNLHCLVSFLPSPFRRSRPRSWQAREPGAVVTSCC